MMANFHLYDIVSKRYRITIEVHVSNYLTFISTAWGVLFLGGGGLLNRSFK